MPVPLHFPPIDNLSGSGKFFSIILLNKSSSLKILLEVFFFFEVFVSEVGEAGDESEGAHNQSNIKIPLRRKFDNEVDIIRPIIIFCAGLGVVGAQL